MRPRSCPVALSLLLSTSAYALPAVEGFDLVGSTRIDRTVYEYQYRVRLRGDAYNYRSAQVTVTNLAPSPSTVLTKGTVNLGTVDAHRFTTSSDTFVVRHDRAKPFDPKTLFLRFSGQPETAEDTSSGLRIGEIAFLTNVTSTGHGGTTEASWEDPPADDIAIISAAVTGSPAIVRSRLLSESGDVLSEQAMSLSPAGSGYLVAETLPVVPFKIEVTAFTAAAASVSWTSTRTYRRSPFRIEARLSKDRVSMGQTAQLELKFHSNAAAGAYVVNVISPTGLMATHSPATVNLAPGGLATIHSSLRAATLDLPRGQKTVIVEVASQGDPSIVWRYFQKILVE